MEDMGLSSGKRTARRSAVGAGVAGLLLATAGASSASDGWITAPLTPLQISTAAGRSQIFSKATPVYGLRLSGFYGVQSKVVGLDLGLFNDATSVAGLGIGLCNITRENGAGVQVGAGCSLVDADFTGVQTGLVNQVSGRLDGLQLGVANAAREGTGLQIGLLNRSTSMRGLQIGVLNWNENGFLPFFPFFNFGG
jgi:hypothetical protein